MKILKNMLHYSKMNLQLIEWIDKQSTHFAEYSKQAQVYPNPTVLLEYTLTLNTVKRAIAAGLGNQHAQLQSTQLMRLLLQRRIHNLKFEDKEWVEHIKRHGIGSIPEEDLQELSRDRGMRALGLTRERLERYTIYVYESYNI